MGAGNYGNCLLFIFEVLFAALYFMYVYISADITGTTRKLGCSFILAFRSNYGSILHRLRDKARYWSKSIIFHTPLHSIDAPVRRVPVGLLPSHLVWKITRMVWLPDGNKKLSCRRETARRFVSLNILLGHLIKVTRNYTFE